MNKKIYVDKFSGKGDVVVLVHGLGGTSNTWYPQAQVLQKQFRPVAYDLDGSGRTGVTGEIKIESHVNDLLTVIDDVSPDAKVHLAGHSLGSIVCQHFATKYPDRLASLVLAGAFPQPPEGARSVLRDRASKARAEGMGGIADAIVIGGTSADVKANQPAAIAFVRESVLGQPPDGYARNCEALALATAADLSGLKVPTLLITGDEDKTAPQDVGRALASAISGAEFHLITACGHWVTIERAKQVNYLMTLFYTRLLRDKTG